MVAIGGGIIVTWWWVKSGVSWAADLSDPSEACAVSEQEEEPVHASETIPSIQTNKRVSTSVEDEDA
jgi:hypothetical protein